MEPELCKPGNNMNEQSPSTFNLTSIIRQFSLQGTAAGISPHGSGHIHDTYRVKNADPGQPDYLLQRINHHVFKNVPALMENMKRVTAYLRGKVAAQPGGQPDKEVLTLVPTTAGQDYYQDEAGNYWRVFLFLEDTRCYDLVETPEQAQEGGKAFGHFQALLADFPVDQLHDTIPDFHNIVSRLQLFREALERDPRGRVKEVTSEIAAIEDRAELMSMIYQLGQAGKLPLRITHNDTKFNNVLLDEHNRAQCVIDLDTVMPGYVAYDFGDAIRTTVNTAAEDEADTDKIQVNMDLFRGFTTGFLAETRGLLSDAEIDSLAMGVLLLPYIMAVRFLTDYIDGDHYYKIHFPGHNLQRARAQLTLVARLEQEYEKIEQTIRQAARAGQEPQPASLTRAGA
ncbi:MAG: phosphotransferase enzyme family protein [Adhaeribacter sp.]